jgi:hypothetical protein
LSVWPPAGARAVDTIEGRLGSIELFELDDPPALLAMGSGFISHSMIRHDIDHAARFAERHPGGWTYLADVRRVRLLDPRNPVALRRINTLPGVRRYVVLAGPLFGKLARFGPGQVTTSIDEALTLLR